MYAKDQIVFALKQSELGTKVSETFFLLYKL